MESVERSTKNGVKELTEMHRFEMICHLLRQCEHVLFALSAFFDHLLKLVNKKCLCKIPNLIKHTGHGTLASGTEVGIVSWGWKWEFQKSVKFEFPNLNKSHKLLLQFMKIRLKLLFRFSCKPAFDSHSLASHPLSHPQTFSRFSFPRDI